MNETCGEPVTPREVLSILEYCLEDERADDPLVAAAITTLSAARNERDRLHRVCASIKRQGNPLTATRDFPDPADFASWVIEQACIAIKEATT